MPFPEFLSCLLIASAEPELKTLPEVQSTAPLKHLNKARPKRAKKVAATRPVPTVTVTAENGSGETAAAAESGNVDEFFKPATVSQTPVVVTNPTPKPRPEKPSKPDDRYERFIYTSIHRLKGFRQS